MRFAVNETLGRIDCAAEPVMVYKKAEIHALTNGPVADPLTGKTATPSSATQIEVQAAPVPPWWPVSAMSPCIRKWNCRGSAVF